MCANDETIRQAIDRREYRAALEALAQVYQHAVTRFCAGMLGEEGEDVAQQVFLGAYMAMPRFRGASSIRTWLFAIARNQCRKALRERQRQRRGDHGELAWRAHRDAPPPPGRDADDPRRLILPLLQELPEQERAIVLMRTHQGLSHAEIAKALNISRRSVERKWAQALRQLGERIKHEMGW